MYVITTEPVCFLMRGQKGVDLGGRGCEKTLEREALGNCNQDKLCEQRVHASKVRKAKRKTKRLPRNNNKIKHKKIKQMLIHWNRTKQREGK